MFHNIRTLIFQLSFDRLIPTATYLSLSFRYCRLRNEIHTQRVCIKTSGSLTYIRTQLFASNIDTSVPFKELKIFRIKRNRLELIDSNRSLSFLQDVPRLIHMLNDDGWTIERNKGHVSRNTFTIEFYNTIQTAWQGSRMLMIVDKADHEMYRWLIHEGSQARHYHGEWKFRYVVIHGEMRSTSFFWCGSREGNARARALVPGTRNVKRLNRSLELPGALEKKLSSVRCVRGVDKTRGGSATLLSRKAR